MFNTEGPLGLYSPGLLLFGVPRNQDQNSSSKSTNQPYYKTLFRPQLESHSQKQQTGTEAMPKDIIRTSFLVPYKRRLDEPNLILTKQKPEKLEVKKPQPF